MARVSFTPNLRLRLSSDLTADSRYNLERIDTLASSFRVDTNNNVNIRSTNDINLLPNSSDIGGLGSGGTVTVGSADQPVDFFSVYATVFATGSAGLALTDAASLGTDKLLSLVYQSDLVGLPDTIADRQLLIDVQAADRQLVLGGDFAVSGGNLSLVLSGVTILSLPTFGTLSTLGNTEILTNKSIDATANNLSNITNTSIHPSASIAGSKISPIFVTDVQTSASYQLTGNGHVTSLTYATSGQTTDVSWALPAADGSSGQVLSTNGAGQLAWSSAAAASALSGLTDVSLSVLADRQVLRYSQGASKWQNQTLTLATTWAPGDGPTKVLAHSLNTTQLLVQIYDENQQLIDVDSITHTSSSVLTLIASQAPASAWTVLLYAL